MANGAQCCRDQVRGGGCPRARRRSGPCLTWGKDRAAGVSGNLDDPDARQEHVLRWGDQRDAKFAALSPSVRWNGRSNQQVVVPTEPARAFAPIQRIGGRQGWYFTTWLWYLRGFLDLLVGGVGLRRGRRHPVELRAGDPLDFWRVEAWEEDRLLRLSAEMKVPGRRLAPVQSGAGGGRQPDQPDGGVRSAQVRRAPLLARALPGPLADLPADAAGDR